MLEIKKRENETMNSLIYRFNKKVMQSGVVKEVKKRQFRDRQENRRGRRLAALYRIEKKHEFERVKKYGK